MTVRPLDLLDLITLYNYRNQVLPLDNARALTHGDMLGLVSLFSYLNPRREISTGISSNEDSIVMGQVTHSDGSSHANLAFLAPEESSQQAQNALLDFLSAQAGAWGCLSVLAEVNENSPVFKVLRQSGFSMYAWQRIWKLKEGSGFVPGVLWKETTDGDKVAIQNLYNLIIPAMLQPMETPPRHATGLVCHQEGVIQAFMSIQYGLAGIWVQPLIHPDATCSLEWMSSMLTSIPNRRSRPVYVCVRSYQAWLENMLEDLGASAGERQAVMVRHLAVLKYAEEPLPAKQAETAWAKPATPVARINHNDVE